MTEVIRARMAISEVDAHLIHHMAELARYWALRSGLAAVLAEHGQSAPGEPDSALPDRSDGLQLAREMLRGMPEVAARALPAPHSSGGKGKVIDVRSLPTRVMGPRRYERVELPAIEIPFSRFSLWIYVHHFFEAHLNDDRLGEFRGRASCGFTGDAGRGTWESTQGYDLEDRVEICRDCALLIPHVVLPPPHPSTDR